MVPPFMITKHWKCPNCGQAGMLAKIKDKDGKTRGEALEGDFRIEQIDGVATMVCNKCGNTAA